ncbi:MAG: DNA-directed RNA polymerase subunit N [Candidatus Aenigmarchaeota archaeon]|nr:DNA-directed RNA polymerase subunit N [Candidatus Aenigmarchaeota archaeon]
MMIPIRCISCGKPIAQYWEKYKEETGKGKDPKKVLDMLGIKRYCCRSVFLTHVNLIDYASKFKK